MATPRKHWFYVADALGRAPLDNDQLACAIRLMAFMNSRRSRDKLTPEQASRAVLRPGDLFEISGRRRLDVARTLLRRAAEFFEISVALQGDFTAITWHKLPEFQGWQSETRARSGSHPTREIPAPTPTPTPGSQEEEKKTDPSGRSPLLNLLSKLDGSPREKELWLAENGPQIEVDAEASREGPKPAKPAQLAVRYYRAYLRRPDREFRTAAEKEVLRAQIAEIRARPDPERDAALARATAERERGPTPETLELWNQMTRRSTGESDVH